MASDQMERGGPEGPQALDHQQKDQAAFWYAKADEIKAELLGWTKVKKMLAQWVKQHDQAVDKYKAEMARLADDWNKMLENERKRDASED